MSAATSSGNRVRLAEIIRRTWTEIRTDDVFGRSAQLAYYFFLALFPFLISVVAMLSLFGNADRGRTLLFALLAHLLPASAFQLISGTLAGIIQASGPLKMSLGIVASIWSASYGMSAVMDTLNAAYGVQETRSLVKQYVIAIAMTIGLGLLTVFATLAVIVGDRVLRALALSRLVMIAWRIAEWPLAAILLLFGFALTYHFAPDLKERTWHWISPGAILGVILLSLASLGLRIYVHFAGSYTAMYGSLGGVIVLLLCFYLGGLAVLSGGVLNGVLERTQSPAEFGALPSGSSGDAAEVNQVRIARPDVAQRRPAGLSAGSHVRGSSPR